MKSHNKHNSYLIKKKWNNRHSYEYGMTKSQYGGWWTPPLSRGRLKKKRRAKRMFLKNDTQKWLENGWIDCEIYRYQQIVTESDDNTTDWICSLCGYDNINESMFCKECDRPYHGYNDQHYFQIHSLQFKKQRTKRKKRKKKNKYKMKKNIRPEIQQNSTESVQFDDNYILQTSNHAKYTFLKRKLLEKLSYFIHSIYEYAICMNVECILKDNWINKININNIESNIVFIDKARCKHWESLANLSFVGDKTGYDVIRSYNENVIREMLKTDPILKHCDNELLVHGYLRANDNKIYIPNDIILITTSFCGVIASLLPYNVNYIDVGQYYRCINKKLYDCMNKKIECYTNIYDVKILFRNSHFNWRSHMKWYSNKEYSVYLCVSLNNDKPKNDKKLIGFNEIIPILKITKKMGYKSLDWKGWLKYSRFHDKQFVIDKKLSKSSFVCPLTKEIMTDPVAQSYWNSHDRRYEREAIEHYLEYNNNKDPFTGKIICNLYEDKELKAQIEEFKKKHPNQLLSLYSPFASPHYTRNGRFNTKTMNNMLKYYKVRDVNRYKRRKWSAYSKLMT